MNATLVSTAGRNGVYEPMCYTDWDIDQLTQTLVDVIEEPDFESFPVEGHNPCKQAV